jgi:methionine sulfoxide reductase heme-binding subunit
MSDRDPFHYLTWLGARSAGLVAFGLAAAAVIAGLAMSTSKSRPGARKGYASRRDLHEQLALAALVAIGLHGALLLADSWLRPGLAGILVPFTTPYRPFWTGLGILAAYLAVLLGLSYYARRLIAARRWRKLHRFTPVIYVLAAAHLLGAGTDRGTLWLRLAVAATAIPIAILVAVRIAELYRRSAGKPAAGVLDEDPIDVRFRERALLAKRGQYLVEDQGHAPVAYAAAGHEGLDRLRREPVDRRAEIL